ncbi:Thiamine-monophosphate kinase [Starkeya nomas]|uniref:Thiamine-monophosphate kinase n=1 Tax=Starkeya nomas TaxID=2666134 RepID=A0A5S9NKR0_9HYPH|nr:thiamine-phosphate kinase [Starkeya nomas]CAA0091259.1 Thiamine-monophosphate kinase [Starkeya nomas]
MTAGGSGDAKASGEDLLIARLFEPIATHPGALGLKDDAALLSVPPGHELVLTKDALVAGVHFFADDPPEAIARKAMRVNLSDLAAKGAEPLGVLLAFAIPPEMDAAALTAFARGIGADASLYGAPLLGGDTVRTPGPFIVSITAFGVVPAGQMVRRATAKPDQAIVVSGTIGDAALGLALRLDPSRAGFAGLGEKAASFLKERYLLPRPRLALARALRGRASGAMDVSDGLVGDLTKMLAASGVAGEIEVDRVPLSPAARAAIKAEPALIETALTGGDDYEILAVMPDEELDAFTTFATAAGIGVSVIGRTQAGQGLTVRASNGAAMTFARGSFSHF